MVNTSDLDWLESLRNPSLSNHALMLCSRFARALKIVDGQTLELRDPKLTESICHATRRTDNPALIKIFNDLVVELKKLTEHKDHTSDRSARDFANANSRKAKTYRGSVLESTNTPDKATETVSRKKGKPVMYRGAIVK